MKNYFTSREGKRLWWSDGAIEEVFGSENLNI
jgi:hypothetical protein